MSVINHWPSPSPSPSPQPGCPAGQPTDGSSCGCSSQGIPSWSVNLASRNLMIRDTPGFYTPGLGPKVSWDLAFNSINPNAASDVGPFSYLLGPNFSCSYGIHVVDYGTTARVVMGDGRTDSYTATGSGRYSAAPGTGIYNVLTKNGDGSFTLVTADRATTYTFANLFNTGGTSYAAVTRQADRYGHALTFAYSGDAVPRLVTLTDANGNASTVSYNSAGQVGQVADPFGGVMQFGYTSVNGVSLLSSLTDQAGYTSTLNYDSQGRVTALTTPLTAPSATNQFAYVGSTGQVTSVTDAAGNSRSYSVGMSSVTKTDELGRATTYNLNSFGGAATFTDALGNQTNTTFDANRNPVRVTNARGFISTFTYDGNGNKLSQTDYLTANSTSGSSVQQSWTYDSSGNVLSATTPAGTESWIYNSNNQVLSWTDRLGNVASNTYNGLGQLLTVKDRNGITTITNSYNANTGRLTSKTDALGNVTSFQWDNRGRRTSITDAAGNTTGFSYDMLNRKIQITFADLTTISYSFSCCQPTQQIDQMGNTTNYIYDNLARLIKVTDPSNATVINSWDAVGNLISRTDANNHTWQWQYNAANAEIGQTDPLGNRELLGYDAVGNVISRTDGTNAVTSFVYDGLDRETMITLADGSTVALAYDAAGNRLTVDDSVGHWSWTYDALGRVTSAQSPLAGSPTRYAYDNEGHRTQLTDPDGNVTSTSYDQAYNVISLGLPVGGQSSSASYQRDARGLLTQRTLPNGIVSSYSYDSLSRVTAINHARSDSTVLFSFAYQYDKAGNLAQEGSQRWDLIANAAGSFQANYAFDSRFELTSEKYYQGGQLGLEMDYTYDSAGNRVKQVNTIPSSSNSPVTFATTYTADDQVTQVVRTAPQDATQTTNYSRDANGSLTQVAGPSGTSGYAYDSELRLVGATLPGGNVSFAYDLAGVRVRKTSAGGAVTNFIMDGSQALQEKNGSGVTQAFYVPQVARIAAGVASFYLEDRLGSIIGLADTNQNVTDTFRYDAWGNVLQRQGTTIVPYQWAGRHGYYQDPDLGLYRLGLRNYSPVVARFTSRDLLSNLITMPNYLYADNNPTGKIDPSGLLGVTLPPIHGNYCGALCPAAGTNPPVLDCLDAACKIHDDCYAKKGYFNPACDAGLCSMASACDSAPGGGCKTFSCRLQTALVITYMCGGKTPKNPILPTIPYPPPNQ